MKTFYKTVKGKRSAIEMLSASENLCVCCFLHLKICVSDAFCICKSVCLLQHGSVSGSRAWEPHHVPGLSAVLFILETKGQQKKEKVCCHKLNFNVVERHFSLFALENYSGQCNIGKLLLGTKGTSTASI